MVEWENCCKNQEQGAYLLNDYMDMCEQLSTENARLKTDNERKERSLDSCNNQLERQRERIKELDELLSDAISGLR